MNVWIDSDAIIIKFRLINLEFDLMGRQIEICRRRCYLELLKLEGWCKYG